MKIKINSYNLDEFNHNDKALWLNGIWSTPELRLPPLYKNIFFPISQCAVKEGVVFIPEWLVSKILSPQGLGNYKTKTLTLLKQYNTERWEEFKNLYPYNQGDTYEKK